MGAAALFSFLAAFFSAAAALPQAPSARQQLREPVLLLLPGHQFPEWAPTPSGQEWYGVFRVNARYELTPVRITFAPINACGDSSVTARRITVAGTRQPDFLVRASGPRLPHWRTGRITWATGRMWLHPGEHRDIQTDSGTYRLAAAGTGAGGNIYDVVLRLRDLHRGASQVLFAYTPPAGAPRELRPGPSIVWVGDLDRDGRPDVLLEDSMSEIAAHYVLWLSSARSGHELVGRAAEYGRGSC